MNVTDFEAGYLRALTDMQAAVRLMVNEPSTSPDGRVDLLGVVSLLESLIDVQTEHQLGTESPE
jgi:hypothetical protein